MCAYWSLVAGRQATKVLRRRSCDLRQVERATVCYQRQSALPLHLLHQESRLEKIETGKRRQTADLKFFPCFSGAPAPTYFLAGFFSASLQANCASLSISSAGASTLAVRVAVFSDDPDKFLDPRFEVTAEDQRIMLAPIGHAVTTEPVLLQNDDDGQGSERPKQGVTAGTIFMVSPCIAMTNYHVVFGQTSERWDGAHKDYKVNVTFGDHTGVGEPFIWGDFSRGLDNDWAAVNVTPCIGNSTGWLPISYTKTALPREVAIFGFYNDRNYSVLAGQNCILIERSPSGTAWKTNCAITHGTSGSPLGIFKDGTFQPTAMAFAMVSHKTPKLTYDPQDANYAIDLFHVFMNTPALATRIADDIKAHGTAIPPDCPLDLYRQACRRPAHSNLAPKDAQAGTPQVALPPTPRDIGLPPAPRDIALPPTPAI